MPDPSGPLDVLVRRVRHRDDQLPLPAYESAGAAGLDLRADVDESIVLAPGERALIPTGLVVELPDGCEAQLRPRSGLALRHGVTLLNSPGTIDSDYRGEIKILMINLGGEQMSIERGDRIAQMVVAPVVRVRWREAEDLSETRRGEGGFGHTGRNRSEG